MSNTWVTCPSEGDNHSKGWLIPHKSSGSADLDGKVGDPLGDLAPKEGPASHQLVGGVTAYQGIDA